MSLEVSIPMELHLYWDYIIIPNMEIIGLKDMDIMSQEDQIM